MSLLRDVLHKNLRRGVMDPSGDLSPNSPPMTKKNYAASIRSSGGVSIHSVAESIVSFHSTITGTRTPKRRRSDVSRLGVPTWHRSNPPPVSDMPGTEAIENEIPFTAAHASSLQTPDERPPWLSVVLYNHGSETSQFPRYFNEAKVQGELRVKLTSPKNIASIDVWCIGKAESTLELAGAPFLNMHANLWKREKGDPQKLRHEALEPFMGKFPSGGYVFPFEFPAFPRDVVVELPPETTNRERAARVPLPPSCQYGLVGGFQGSVRYYLGVNVRYDDLMGVDEEYDIPFSYYQRVRSLPQEISPFPFISTKEDWPFRREVLGGWTLTPFGARGRFDDEVVEVEGILGVQTPEAYAAGQTVRFGLLLWSKSPVALQALSRPEMIDVVLIRSDLHGTDVLRPRNSSRRNRTLHRISQGRIWYTDDGPPAKLATDGEENEKTRSHSPTPSLEVMDEEGFGDTIRMDGEVCVAWALPPSFRYKYMGCEYFLQLKITHPNYSHISPSGPGIQAETPLWVVTDPARDSNTSSGQFNATPDSSVPFNLPLSDKVADIGSNANRASHTLGEFTTKERPTWRTQRMAAF